MRRLALLSTTGVLVLALAGPAWACGGLVAPNGAVSLLRTTTLAGYHGGVEHYVTAFDFTGGSQVGSIVPLPAVPTKVERGGDWTLQRLELEVQPPIPAAEGDGVVKAATLSSVQVLLKTKIEALDITVLKGGGTAVGNWARKHGFALSPDAPKVLDFYARRSPIFMAARFDAGRAKDQGLVEGQGTPIHLTIPTSDPWVPIRILALGKSSSEVVDADIFLLTDSRPQMLPAPELGAGFRVPANPDMALLRSEQASPTLIRDLRSDRGMDWIPASGMWLSYLSLHAPAGHLGYDLAVDANGGAPSPQAAGVAPARAPSPSVSATQTLLATVALIGLLVGVGTLERRSARVRV